MGVKVERRGRGSEERVKNGEGWRGGGEGKGSINFMQHENYQQYILVTIMRGERGGEEFTDLFSNNISKGSVIVIQFG